MESVETKSHALGYSKDLKEKVTKMLVVNQIQLMTQQASAISKIVHEISDGAGSLPSLTKSKFVFHPQTL